MRHELRAALQKGGTDNVILHSFVQEYSARVLNVPREMNGLALIVFLTMVTATVSVMIVFVRKRQSRRAMLTTTAAEVDALSRVREKAEHDNA